MNYYQELTIIPCPDVDPFFVWGRLFTQVHLALVEVKNPDQTSNIGVSFPEYRYFEKNGKTIKYLGSKLRVFASTEDELVKLNLSQWCERLSDYVHIKSIAAIPDKAISNVIVKRFRQVKNNDRITESFAKKYGKTFEEVKSSRIDYLKKTRGITEVEAENLYNNPKLEERPYIILGSLENKHRFSLEIDQREFESAVSGTFSTYGLSSTTTVPHW
ncbi:MAG: type I-F CRISPR-associated endoribonuclease Cas6/Csy4 [Gammaproteobacteria bacterium]|nr:type I-F CRISPR-associated endoribonuclease Cas6/Csy4 [Gammaproteobacteria bacterium]